MIINSFLTTNYFLSGWIANLGVVPWFAFLFFLLAPAFLSFNFLLVLVCCVFEAIFLSLCLFLNNIRELFVYKIPALVKIFLVSVLCATSIAQADSKDIFLSKGEQIELSSRNLRSFSVGNKEVIKYKYLPSKGIIHIKAKGLGFSDLIITSKRGKKTTYRFYITSKKEQLAKMQLAQIFKDTELSLNAAGKMIELSGAIEQLSTYKKIHYLKNQKDNKSSIIYNLTLHPKLRNKLIAKLYLAASKDNIEYIFCDSKNETLLCDYEAKHGEAKYLFVQSQESFAKLYNLNKSKLDKNYIIEFKIIALQNTDSNQINSGIDSLETELDQLIRNNKAQLNTGSIFLQRHNNRAKVLSTPRVHVLLDDKFKLELGTELPIRSKEKEKTHIEWKFSGLKLNGKLSLFKNRIKLQYNTELTEPTAKGINSPKAESSIFLDEHKLTELYSLSYEQYQKFKIGIPLLSQTPLIGHFFESKQNGHSTQKIKILAMLKVAP